MAIATANTQVLQDRMDSAVQSELSAEAVEVPPGTRAGAPAVVAPNERGRIAAPPVARREPITLTGARTQRVNILLTASVLVAADVVALQGLLIITLVAFALVAPEGAAALWGAEHLQLAVSILVLPLAYVISGLRPGYGLCPMDRFRRTVLSGGFVFAIMLAWTVLSGFGGAGLPGALPLLTTLVLSVFMLPFVELSVRSVLQAFWLWGVPVVVVGATDLAESLVSTLRRDRAVGLRPSLIVDDRAASRIEGRRVRSELASLAVHGAVDDVARLAPGVRRAIVAIPDASQDRLAEIAERLPFASIFVVSDQLALQTQCVSATDLGGTMGIAYQRSLLVPHNRLVKRILDLVLGGLSSAVALPLVAVAALAIKIADPGPAFYRQERIGKNGRRFRMLKLRTMVVNADAALERHLMSDPAARREWETYMKLRHDPRVIPWVGRLLRVASIDELPQLWHVLRGEMSLVGPRPFPAYHVLRFPLAFQSLRHTVPPGITGFWQVNDRSNGDLSVQEAQDRYYVRNWSIWMDLYILGCTLRAVITGSGAR